MVSTLESSAENRRPEPGTMFVPFDRRLLQAVGTRVGMFSGNLMPFASNGFLRSDQLFTPISNSDKPDNPTYRLTDASEEEDRPLKDPESTPFLGAFHDLCAMRGIREQVWQESIVPSIKVLMEGYAGKKRRSQQLSALHPVMVATMSMAYAPPSLWDTPQKALRLARCSLMHDYVEDTIFKLPEITAMHSVTNPHRAFEQKYDAAEMKLSELDDLNLSDSERRIVMALTVDKELYRAGAKKANHEERIATLTDPFEKDLACYIRVIDKSINLLAGEADPDKTLLDNLKRWNKQIGEALHFTVPIMETTLRDDEVRSVCQKILADALRYSFDTINVLSGSVPNRGKHRKPYNHFRGDVHFNFDSARNLLHLNVQGEGSPYTTFPVLGKLVGDTRTQLASTLKTTDRKR